MLVVSIFAFFTKIDFTIQRGDGIVIKPKGAIKTFAFFLLILVILTGIVLVLVATLADDFTVYIMMMVYGALGALAMVFGLIVDTQMMIIGKHKYSYNPEDYVFAACSIFIDIITLFIVILLFLAGAIRGGLRMCKL